MNKTSIVEPVMKKALMLCILTTLVLKLSSPTHAKLTGQARIDSLKNVLNTAKDDTNKVNTILKICASYMHSNPDSCLGWAKKMLALSEKTGFKRGMAHAYWYFGKVSSDRGNMGEAMKCDSMCLKLYEECGDKAGMAKGYISISNLFQRQGNFPEALKNIFISLKILQKTGNKKDISACLSNIGKIYYSQGNYPEALKYYSEGLKMAEEIQYKPGMLSSYINIGANYINQKNYPEAMKFFLSAKQYAEEAGNKRSLALIINNIGNIHYHQKNYPEALKNYFTALKFAETVNDKNNASIIYMNIGDTYTKLKKFTDAAQHLDKALSLAKSSENIESTRDIFLTMSQLDSAEGKPRQALEHYKMYISLRDSLVNNENTRKLTQQQMQYDFDKKEESAKAEQDKKDLVQRNVRYSMMGGLAGLVIFLLVVFRQRNKISKEKKRSDELLVKSDNLLLNILPSEVAEEIKKEGHSKARTFSMVTVMFTDFKGFSAVSEKVSAELLVAEIDHCFSAFDNIIHKHRVEKIKTVGDAYICVGGMPALTLTHATDVLSAAIEIRDFMLERKKQQDAVGGISFELRLGIHTGPVVAGIVGVKKYAYDIWGDTVNIAARMEQNSEAGRINISGNTYELVKTKYNCLHRGKIEAKNKGMIDMYFVEEKNSEIAK